MKTFRVVRFLFAALLAATGTLTAQAQPTTRANSAGLASTSWLVTVDGEAKTRTLLIASATPKSDGSLLLEATYGLTGGGMHPAEAQMGQSGSQRQLTLTTSANSTIIATERPDGTFQGTFTNKNGVVKGVIVAKLSGDIRLAAKSATEGTPAGDIPSECSAYAGAWVGRWNQGGFGDMYLRITDVRSVGGEGCMARYSYSSKVETVPSKKTLEIKDGAIAFVCNSSTGGTCVFTRKNDALWASYTNPGGGQNSGVFKRVE